MHSKNGSVAQLNRASDYGSEGYRFESCRSHKKSFEQNCLKDFSFKSILFCKELSYITAILKAFHNLLKQMSINDTIYYNKLRTLATIAVITIHASSTLFYHRPIGSESWWIATFFDTIARFGVPIFLMISGALLLPKKEDMKSFYSKRLHRILIPFLLWLTIYYFHNLPVNISLSEKFYRLLNGICSGSSYHLWYIYMLVGIYLAIPAVRIWVQNISTQSIRIILLFWGILLLLRLTDETGKLVKSLNIEFFYYLGYPIAGYYLSILKFHKPHQTIRRFSIAAIIIGILLTLSGTYILSLYKGKTDELFFNCLSPTVALMSSGIFLLFKHIEFKKEKVPGKWICTYSYGIYLCHVYVLEQLKSVYWIKYTYYIHPTIGIPALVISCLLLSLLLTMTIHKIPRIGKYISG